MNHLSLTYTQDELGAYHLYDPNKCQYTHQNNQSTTLPTEISGLNFFAADTNQAFGLETFFPTMKRTINDKNNNLMEDNDIYNRTTNDSVLKNDQKVQNFSNFSNDPKPENFQNSQSTFSLSQSQDVVQYPGDIKQPFCNLQRTQINGCIANIEPNLTKFSVFEPNRISTKQQKKITKNQTESQSQQNENEKNLVQNNDSYYDIDIHEFIHNDQSGTMMNDDHSSTNPTNFNFSKNKIFFPTSPLSQLTPLSHSLNNPYSLKSTILRRFIPFQRLHPALGTPFETTLDPVYVKYLLFEENRLNAIYLALAAAADLDNYSLDSIGNIILNMNSLKYFSESSEEPLEPFDEGKKNSEKFLTIEQTLLTEPEKHNDTRLTIEQKPNTTCFTDLTLEQQPSLTLEQKLIAQKFFFKKLFHSLHNDQDSFILLSLKYPQHIDPNYTDTLLGDNFTTDQLEAILDFFQKKENQKRNFIFQNDDQTAAGSESGIQSPPKITSNTPTTSPQTTTSPPQTTSPQTTTSPPQTTSPLTTTHAPTNTTTSPPAIAHNTITSHSVPTTTTSQWYTQFNSILAPSDTTVKKFDQHFLAKALDSERMVTKASDSDKMVELNQNFLQSQCFVLDGQNDQNDNQNDQKNNQNKDHFDPKNDQNKDHFDPKNDQNKDQNDLYSSTTTITQLISKPKLGLDHTFDISSCEQAPSSLSPCDQALPSSLSPCDQALPSSLSPCDQAPSSLSSKQSSDYQPSSSFPTSEQCSGDQMDDQMGQILIQCSHQGSDVKMDAQMSIQCSQQDVQIGPMSIQSSGQCTHQISTDQTPTQPSPTISPAISIDDIWPVPLRLMDSKEVQNFFSLFHSGCCEKDANSQASKMIHSEHDKKDTPSSQTASMVQSENSKHQSINHSSLLETSPQDQHQHQSIEHPSLLETSSRNLAILHHSFHSIDSQLLYSDSIPPYRTTVPVNSLSTSTIPRHLTHGPQIVRSYPTTQADMIKLSAGKFTIPTERFYPRDAKILQNYYQKIIKILNFEGQNFYQEKIFEKRKKSWEKNFEKNFEKRKNIPKKNENFNKNSVSAASLSHRSFMDSMSSDHMTDFTPAALILPPACPDELVAPLLPPSLHPRHLQTFNNRVPRLNTSIDLIQTVQREEYLRQFYRSSQDKLSNKLEYEGRDEIFEKSGKFQDSKNLIPPTTSSVHSFTSSSSSSSSFSSFPDLISFHPSLMLPDSIPTKTTDVPIQYDHQWSSIRDDDQLSGVGVRTTGVGIGSTTGVGADAMTGAGVGATAGTSKKYGFQQPIQYNNDQWSTEYNFQHRLLDSYSTHPDRLDVLNPPQIIIPRNDYLKELKILFERGILIRESRKRYENFQKKKYDQQQDQKRLEKFKKNKKTLSTRSSLSLSQKTSKQSSSLLYLPDLTGNNISYDEYYHQLVPPSQFHSVFLFPTQLYERYQAYMPRLGNPIHYTKPDSSLLLLAYMIDSKAIQSTELHEFLWSFQSFKCLKEIQIQVKKEKMYMKLLAERIGLFQDTVHGKQFSSIDGDDDDGNGGNNGGNRGDGDFEKMGSMKKAKKDGFDALLSLKVNDDGQNCSQNNIQNEANVQITVQNDSGDQNDIENDDTVQNEVKNDKISDNISNEVSQNGKISDKNISISRRNHLSGNLNGIPLRPYRFDTIIDQVIDNSLDSIDYRGQNDCVEQQNSSTSLSMSSFARTPRTPRTTPSFSRTQSSLGSSQINPNYDSRTSSISSQINPNHDSTNNRTTFPPSSLTTTATTTTLTWGEVRDMSRDDIMAFVSKFKQKEKIEFEQDLLLLRRLQEHYNRKFNQNRGIIGQGTDGSDQGTDGSGKGIDYGGSDGGIDDGYDGTGIDGGDGYEQKPVGYVERRGGKKKLKNTKSNEMQTVAVDEDKNTKSDDEMKTVDDDGIENDQKIKSNEMKTVDVDDGIEEVEAITPKMLETIDEIVQTDGLDTKMIDDGIQIDLKPKVVDDEAQTSLGTKMIDNDPVPASPSHIQSHLVPASPSHFVPASPSLPTQASLSPSSTSPAPFLIIDGSLIPFSIINGTTQLIDEEEMGKPQSKIKLSNETASKIVLNGQEIKLSNETLMEGQEIKLLNETAIEVLLNGTQEIKLLNKSSEVSNDTEIKLLLNEASTETPNNPVFNESLTETLSNNQINKPSPSHLVNDPQLTTTDPSMNDVHKLLTEPSINVGQPSLTDQQPIPPALITNDQNQPSIPNTLTPIPTDTVSPDTTPTTTKKPRQKIQKLWSRTATSLYTDPQFSFSPISTAIPTESSTPTTRLKHNISISPPSTVPSSSSSTFTTSQQTVLSSSSSSSSTATKIKHNSSSSMTATTRAKPTSMDINPWINTIETPSDISNLDVFTKDDIFSLFFRDFENKTILDLSNDVDNDITTINNNSIVSGRITAEHIAYIRQNGIDLEGFTTDFIEDFPLIGACQIQNIYTQNRFDRLYDEFPVFTHSQLDSIAYDAKIQGVDSIAYDAKVQGVYDGGKDGFRPTMTLNDVLLASGAPNLSSIKRSHCPIPHSSISMAPSLDISAIDGNDRLLIGGVSTGFDNPPIDNATMCDDLIDHQPVDNTMRDDLTSIPSPNLTGTPSPNSSFQIPSTNTSIDLFNTMNDSINNGYSDGGDCNDNHDKNSMNNEKKIVQKETKEEQYSRQSVQQQSFQSTTHQTQWSDEEFHYNAQLYYEEANRRADYIGTTRTSDAIVQLHSDPSFDYIWLHSNINTLNNTPLQQYDQFLRFWGWVGHMVGLRINCMDDLQIVIENEPVMKHIQLVLQKLNHQTNQYSYSSSYLRNQINFLSKKQQNIFDQTDDLFIDYSGIFVLNDPSNGGGSNDGYNNGSHFQYAKAPSIRSPSSSSMTKSTSTRGGIKQTSSSNNSTTIMKKDNDSSSSSSFFGNSSSRNHFSKNNENSNFSKNNSSSKNNDNSNFHLIQEGRSPQGDYTTTPSNTVNIDDMHDNFNNIDDDIDTPKPSSMYRQRQDKLIAEAKRQKQMKKYKKVYVSSSEDEDVHDDSDDAKTDSDDDDRYDDGSGKIMGIGNPTKYNDGKYFDSHSFKCKICTCQIPVTNSRRKHIKYHELFKKAVNNRKSPFKCLICSLGFDNLKKIKYHHTIFHKNNKKESVLFTLGAGKRNANIQLNAKCPICDADFAPALIQGHMRSKHRDMFL